MVSSIFLKKASSIVLLLDLMVSNESFIAFLDLFRSSLDSAMRLAASFIISTISGVKQLSGPIGTDLLVELFARNLAFGSLTAKSDCDMDSLSEGAFFNELGLN